MNIDTDTSPYNAEYLAWTVETDRNPESKITQQMWSRMQRGLVT